jgi:hypothetical protein
MKKALLVGVNYTSIPAISLYGCINDTINMRNMLIDAYGYSASNIIHLRDDVDKVTLKPTRENIINNLKLLAEQSANLTELWIHYSGHGSQIRDTNGDELDKIDEVIIPLDYQTNGVITDDELLNIIKTIKCRTILLFDSCHSGTVCDLTWLFEYKSANTYLKTQPNKTVIANPNIFMFSGCKDEQTSSDAYFKSDKCAAGAFTNALLTGLRYYRHNVSIGNLYQYICNYLKSTGFTQIPILSTTTQTPSYTFLRASVAPSNNRDIFSQSTTGVISQTMRSIISTK